MELLESIKHFRKASTKLTICFFVLFLYILLIIIYDYERKNTLSNNNTELAISNISGDFSLVGGVLPVSTLRHFTDTINNNQIIEFINETTIKRKIFIRLESLYNNYNQYYYIDSSNFNVSLQNHMFEKDSIKLELIELIKLNIKNENEKIKDQINKSNNQIEREFQIFDIPIHIPESFVLTLFLFIFCYYLIEYLNLKRYLYLILIANRRIRNEEIMELFFIWLPIKLIIILVRIIMFLIIIISFYSLLQYEDFIQNNYGKITLIIFIVILSILIFLFLYDWKLSNKLMQKITNIQYLKKIKYRNI